MQTVTEDQRRSRRRSGGMKIRRLRLSCGSINRKGKKKKKKLKEKKKKKKQEESVKSKEKNTKKQTNKQ